MVRILFCLHRFKILILLKSVSFFRKQIPCIVIVQPHMLKDKGSVRLRSVLLNGQPDTAGNNERFVLLEDLAGALREFSQTTSTGHDESSIDPALNGGGQNQSNSNRDVGRTMEPSIECICVLSDQFFDSERPVAKGDTTNMKNVLKTMKSVTQRAEAFVLAMADPRSTRSMSKNGLPVFAVSDVPFWCLRDFGSNLMRKPGEKSSSNASAETINSHPTHKRSIKTLGIAIDNYMKRSGFWQGGSGFGNSIGKESSRREAILLLYSKPDDQFDLVTLRLG
jgi:hypothetical protein